jgi:hypothetical protein
MAPGNPQNQIVVQVTDTVTKTDLESAKNDLRREMRLWLGVGSAAGTTLAGFIGAFTSGGHTAVTTALGFLPL